MAQEPLPGEVLVVGRRHDKAAREVVVKWASKSACPVKWICVDEAGFLAPILKGVAEAAGELVAIIDDDAEPEAIQEVSGMGHRSGGLS